MRKRLAWIAAVVLTCLAVPAAASAAAETAGDYPSLEALEREISRLAENARPSVVSVVTRSRLDHLLTGIGETVEIEEPSVGRVPLARRIGTGVVIDADGHVATLASVVEDASDIVVIGPDGRRLDATLKGSDPVSGLAVLDVEDHRALRPVTLGEADLKVGALVTTLGAGQDGRPAYAIGFVSGSGVSEGPLRRGPYIRLNAYTAPGGAGGPVFDSAGRLVGLLFAARGHDAPEEGGAIRWEWKGRPEAEEPYLHALHRAGAGGGGVSYAVPVDVVRRITDQIIRHGAVKRAWLGVTIESVEPGQVHVARVFEGSPAEISGLAAGDVIVQVDGEPLSVPEALVEKISISPPGTELDLVVRRGAKPREINVTLQEKKASAAPRARVFLMRAPAPPRLGVNVEALEEEMRRRLGPLDEGVGLLVRDVQPHARAEAAGVLPGDVIIAAMGDPIGTVRELRRALQRQRPGQTMPLDVIRAGKTIVLMVPPPEPPPAPVPPPPPPPPKRP